MDTFTTLVLCIVLLLTANGHTLCISSFSETRMNYSSWMSALGSGEISGSLATLAGARAGGSPCVSLTGVQRDMPHESYTNLFQEHTPSGLMSVPWLKQPLDITTQGNKIPTWASGEQSAKKRKLQKRGKGKRHFLVFLPLLFASWGMRAWLECIWSRNKMEPAALA